MSFVLALDQGTTSSRAIVFDHAGAMRAVAQREFTQHYPQPGWVEHDPTEIWATQSSVIAEAIAKAGIEAADLAAIGITNQRETTVLWDRTTGRPIANAIVWQDRRTADTCDALRSAGHEQLIRRKTGLVVDAYFSGTKLKWLLDHVPGARERARRGELAFGPIDAWLCGTCPVARVTSPTHRTRAARCCSTYIAAPGTTSCSRCSTSSVGPPERGCRRARARTPCCAVRPCRSPALRRPAGGAVRPGLPVPRSREEHVWHRLFLLLNTGRTAVRSATTCSPRSRGRATASRRTRSKAACSSPGRSCNGCAMACSWYVPRKTSRLWRRACPTMAAYSCAGVRRLGAPHWDVCARRDIRSDAWHHRCSPRPCRARIHRVPKRRRAVGDGSRRRHQGG